MKNHTHALWGIGICTVLLFSTFLISDGGYLMFNAEGLLVVIAGTLGATLISYPKKAIHSAAKVAINSYQTVVPTG